MNTDYFWEKPIYLPYLHETLTDEKLADFEQKIGYKLPDSVVKLLKNQNGGYLHYGLPETPPMQFWGIGESYPSLILLSDEFDQTVDYEYLSFSLRGLLAFDGDGRYYHCLDYRQNPENPQVSYIDIEVDYQEVIAENFDEFLKLLELNHKDYWFIKSEKSLEEILKIFKNQLIIKLEKLDDYDYGYTQHRGKYDGHWFWLFSNEVPYAFARKGENNYHQVKNYEGKTAFRFPEIEKNIVILTTYEPKIITKLTENLKGILEIVRYSELITD